MGKRALLVLSLLITFCCNSYAGEKNNLRTLFLNNQANICGINIRTFNAKDTNGNEIIDGDEESGNFVNAIERLDEIKELGINTLHILPITPTGKLKALGTAGSLYAISDFCNINPQITDESSELPALEQAKLFVKECHNRNIKVIIDLPSCGSYDLFLSHPELFIKDDKQCSVVPTDWTDVRLLKTGNNEKLNTDVLDVHKKFVDMVFEIGADGIRADVATIKPANFWKELIQYARDKDAEFMFLAEASDSWREPPSKYAEFTPYNILLEAGFDGYYGSFFNLKDWNAAELTEHIKFNKKLLASYKEPKSVIMSFTTHDELSPVVLHGEDYSILICWLQAVLPFNPYTIDGFSTGDKYLYPWANTKANYTDTDDDTFFVHRGKLDIFNFSRKPDGQNQKISDNFKNAYKFRNENIELITKGDFVPVKFENEKVFIFCRTLNNEKLLVLGNLDYKNTQTKLKIKIPKLSKKTKTELIHGKDDIKIEHRKLITELEPAEIKVIKLKF